MMFMSPLGGILAIEELSLMNPSQNAICRGSYVFGSACGRCRRCQEEMHALLATLAAHVLPIRKALDEADALVTDRRIELKVGDWPTHYKAKIDRVMGLDILWQLTPADREPVAPPTIPEADLTPVDIDLGAWEFHCVDHVFIKQMHLPKAGTLVPQHVHKYDHNSMVAAGCVRVWKREEWIGDYHAPTAIFIENGVPHTLQALQDDTVVYCIHNVSRSGGAVEITAENRLKGLGG